MSAGVGSLAAPSEDFDALDEFDEFDVSFDSAVVKRTLFAFATIFSAVTRASESCASSLSLSAPSCATDSDAASVPLAFCTCSFISANRLSRSVTLNWALPNSSEASATGLPVLISKDEGFVGFPILLLAAASVWLLILSCSSVQEEPEHRTSAGKQLSFEPHHRHPPSCLHWPASDCELHLFPRGAPAFRSYTQST